MRLFPIFTGLFVAVLMISQVTAVKPVQWRGLAITGADLIFPLSYLLGDLVTEVYGFRRSRVVIWTGLAANVLLSLAVFAVGGMPGAPDWVAAGGQEAWDMLLGLTPRIAVASLLAYFAGEFVDSDVLARMKVRTRGRFLGLRTIGSSLVGQAVDSMIFFPVAYWGAWPWTLILHIMVVAYVVKVGVEVVLTPVVYVLVAIVKRVTGMDVYDHDTRFNPFDVRLENEEQPADPAPGTKGHGGR